MYKFPNLGAGGQEFQTLSAQFWGSESYLLLLEVPTPTKTPYSALYKYGGLFTCKGCLVCFYNTRMRHQFDRKGKKREQVLPITGHEGPEGE